MKNLRMILYNKIHKDINHYELATQAKEFCRWLGNGDFTYENIKGLLEGETSPYNEIEENFLRSYKTDIIVFKAILATLYCGIDKYYDHEKDEVKISYLLPPTRTLVIFLQGNLFRSYKYFLNELKKECYPFINSINTNY